MPKVVKTGPAGAPQIPVCTGLPRIWRNSDGASATREILSHELARGRDRLAGKILVIWQFATRELAFGNWKLLDMSLRQPSHVHFFTPQAGEEITVTGTVAALAAVPRPGSVP